MKIKDILLPLTSYPIPTEARSIENAVVLAKRMGAQMSAIAFAMDIESLVGLFADPIGVSGILAADRKKSADNASDLLSIFEMIGARHGIVFDHSLLHCNPLNVPQRVVEEARFHDVTIVALREGDAAWQDIAARLVFESGRPIVVYPDDAKRELALSLENVAVAWDFSGPSTRAITDALPLLQEAKQVRVFTVVDDKLIAKSKSGERLAKHLARHGAEVSIEDVKSEGRAIGSVFQAYVSEHNIDLLVMGAYGHSRMREYILGGATRSILSRPPTWVLLAR
jgi:nucleotide-binding universal stress UspA family protein